MAFSACYTQHALSTAMIPKVLGSVHTMWIHIHKIWHVNTCQNLCIWKPK